MSRFHLLCAYHDPKVLQQVELPSNSDRLLLGTLPIPGPYTGNKFAENRALLYYALNPRRLPNADHIGLFHASYPTKFPRLVPFKDLEGQLELQDNVFTCVCTTSDWLRQAESCHPGIQTELIKLFRAAGIKWDCTRLGPLTNSFVAPRHVWEEFLPVWLRGFIAAQDQVNSHLYEGSMCKSGLEGAYLLERITTAYFSGRADLEAKVLTVDGKWCYEALMLGERPSGVDEAWEAVA